MSLLSVTGRNTKVLPDSISQLSLEFTWTEQHFPSETLLREKKEEMKY